MDGVGEWATTTIGAGRGNTLSIDREIRFPHSLGLLYATFTAFLGFRVNSGEGKVMGLAPYGSPRFAPTILDNLIDVRADGSFALNMSYFDFAWGPRMFNGRFASLFGCAPRQPESNIEQRHMDIAASIQAVTEHVVLALAAEAARTTESRSLCLAGGVALNCVANGRLQQAGLFDRVWVQPAPGDAGGAIGAALGVYYHALKNDRLAAHGGGADAMQACLLGPEFADQDICEQLDQMGAVYSRLGDAALTDAVASALSQGRIVGWFQGRMEFGPRALGARSILADPRLPDMKATLNRKIKRREDFRPFAPSVLAEDAKAWFDLRADSPHMQFVATAQTEDLHAVTHVDMTSRVQTVDADANPHFHRLLSRFKSFTGCPVLVNTSFNVRGEPIVASPRDAYRCFMATDLDVLAIGNLVLYKHDQPTPQIPPIEFPLD
jgi:carbamoyltransferase